jgi:hypothetical protein
MTGSYDDRQREAILVRCIRCLRWHWMTVPQFICARCR